MGYAKTSQTAVNTEQGKETPVKVLKPRKKSNTQLVEELLKKTTFTIDPNLKSSGVLTKKAVEAKEMFDKYYENH